MAASTLTTITNYFRPTRGEALVRVRVNVLCMLTIWIATYLLPIPSIPASIHMVVSQAQEDRENALGIWSRGISLFEVLVTALCSYNIMEGLYAIKYPRAPLPPAHISPAKKKQALLMTPTSTKRPNSILSPNATPSKIFSSPSKSFSLSQRTNLAGSLTPGKYAESPFSTPSRVVKYNIPSSATSVITNASSTSTMPPTPSPNVSAYRGKQASSGNTGRPMDGLYLSQMTARVEDDDEDEYDD